MDIDDIKGIFAYMFLMLICVFIGVYIGTDSTQLKIKNDCRLVGVTIIDSQIYYCTKKVSNETVEKP